jgi:DnaK suppressor protein
MKNNEIQRFRSYLQTSHEETLRSLNRLDSEARAVDPNCPQDVADLCSSSTFKESLFQRSSESRRLLRRIELALASIQEGTYGICLGCGEEINPRRLDALPWTRYCLHCQQARERETRAVDSVASVPFKRAG